MKQNLLLNSQNNSTKFIIMGFIALCLSLGIIDKTFSEDKSMAVSEGLFEMQRDFRQIAKAVLPSVVEILTTLTNEKPAPQVPFLGSPFGQQVQPDQKTPKQSEKVQGLGSGVIVRRDASQVYILTNNHVIDKAETIQVTLGDGRKFEAKLLGADARRDLALISIQSSDKEIVVAKLGNSNELQVGDLVLAIGNPFGLDFTVTNGIVSALGRHGGPDDSNFVNYIQTDASINEGNSGGALVNLMGEIIGINTWIASPNGASVGLGFAIPIDTAKRPIDDFVTYGAVHYGWLGAEVSGITDVEAKDLGLPSTQGAFIFSIFKDSPADKAGILPGDFVIRINGQDIKDANALVQMVGDLPVGKTVDFQILRQAQKTTKVVTIEERIKESEISGLLTWPGLLVVEITPQIRDQLSLTTVVGVVVAEVDAHSTAEIAGIKPQDVVTKINDESVKTVADFYRLLNTHQGGEVKIGFMRQGVELSIGIAR